MDVIKTVVLVDSRGKKWKLTSHDNNTGAPPLVIFAPPSTLRPGALDAADLRAALDDLDPRGARP